MQIVVRFVFWERRCRGLGARG